MAGLLGLITGTFQWSARLVGLPQAWSWAMHLISFRGNPVAEAWDRFLEFTDSLTLPRQRESVRHGAVVRMPLLSDQTNMDDQARSAFLSRLPVEVRWMVYDLVLPDERQLWIRAVSSADSVGGGSSSGATAKHFEHYPATTSSIRALYARHASNGGCEPGGDGFWQCADMDDITYIHRESAALMLSCKRIYLDLLPQWTLCFNHLPDLEAFAACTASLGSGFPRVRRVLFAPALPSCFHADSFKGPPLAIGLRDDGSSPDGAGEQAPQQPARAPCIKHAGEWAEVMRRLDGALRLFRPAVAELVLYLAPIRSYAPGYCDMVGQSVLLDGVREITGVPVIVAEAPWTDLEALPRGMSVDRPHPDPGCRLVARWPIARDSME